MDERLSVNDVDRMHRVRRRAWIACACVATLLACAACASKPPPPPAHVAEEHEEPDAGPEDTGPPPTVTIDMPERSRPPSTASYEEAMSVPENLDVRDDRAHLTDAQLLGPMRTVMNGCPTPRNAKVTIKAAVQAGRAIGVTVHVKFDRGKAKRPPPPSALKWEAKTSARIVKCVDKAVRDVVWPPSGRGASFTTEF
jgi:hypothetical protein